MDDAVIAKLRELAAAGLAGILIVGTVAEAKTVPAGTDRSGQAYAGYQTARIAYSLGQSISVKLPAGPLPKAGEKRAFICSRVWKGQSGMGAEADLFV